MTPELLLQHFNRISEAPDAVPRLRRFILDLAVRGKLVEQDPSDEPAGQLLKRIQAEKAQLIKEGKIKEPKESSKTVSKPPYDLPVTWKWVPLGITVNSHLGGGTPSKNNSTYWDGDICWASVKDIGKGKYVDSTIDRISEAGLKDSSSNLVPPGNLIVVTRMGLGKISINRIPIAINQDLRALFLSSQASIDYYYNFFKTYGFDGSGLTVKGIRVEELLNTPFPLPPLAEQHRIVAKVDELMALCDQLEAARNQREAHRDKLVAASLNRISNTVADEATQAASFHLTHLPRLTTKPEHIKQLRQTILDLAVRGRLVEQDPNDEPAAELLKRLGLKHSMIPDGGLDPALTSIHQTWALVRFDDVAITGGGVTLGRKLSNRKTITLPYLRVANVKRGELDLAVVKEVEIAEDEFERYALRVNDLLMTEGGDWDKVGRATIWRGEISRCLHQNHIFRSRMLSEELLPRWFELYFNSPVGRVYFESASKQTTNLASINMRQVRGCPIPLPPLAEQHRIVAKVDQLMALCDQLEAQLTTTESDSRRLLEAVLRDALNPEVKEAA